MTVNVEVIGKNLEVGPRVEDYVEKKTSKLDRYLPEIDTARVELEYIKSARNANDRYIAQITVHGKKALLRTEERADDIRAAFDNALDKMQRQLERFKGKHYHGRGSGRTAAEVVAEKEEIEEIIEISRRKTFNLVPMKEAEALEQMRLLGHDNFFVFFNSGTKEINVLYRRRDGSYGIIEPKLS
jgi:putative sigma-54 modulation protein